MNIETAKHEIRKNWRQLIPYISDGYAKTKVNGEKSYVCPICGHGTNGDGLTWNPRSFDGNSLKCFGCDFSGDIINLYQQKTGEDYISAVSILAKKIGISIDNSKNSETLKQNLKDINLDYSEYYKECTNRLSDPIALEYLKNRGISLSTALEYSIGFDPCSDPANNPGGINLNTSKYPCPRIIIPTSENHYIARSVDPNIPSQFAKINVKGSSPSLFNGNALYNQNIQEIFIVEGAFDALSVLEVGSTAVALNSISNVDLFINYLENIPNCPTLILCLDNDGKSGTLAALQKLQHELTKLNINHISANICGDYKDPNEALISNRDEFINSIENAKYLASAKPDNTSDYIDKLMTSDIEKFKNDIKTGYSNLDRECGGLYGGLYCIAAISSLGKTTFAAQMADQIAEQGTDVLFFSLEQSRLELVSKSIARKTAQNNIETAVTSLSIRKGYLPLRVIVASEEYKAEVEKRISIIEGNFNCDIIFISNYIKQYIHRNNCRPVVFIDYLQILQSDSENKKQSTKEKVDNIVTELKRLSREYSITIFIISSVNRTNYLTPIDFESLKESGGIEYTCDCIWGLQLQCLNEPIFNQQNNIKERRERIKQAKSEIPRKVELVSLKNRYGVSTFSCLFDYYPANDLFVPVENPITEFTGLPKKAGRKI